MDSGSTGAAARRLSALFQVGTAAGLGDRVLLERFADRRGADDPAAEAAFAALVERHGPMVLRVCRAVLGDRHEAEDAFQATFLVLASRARSIRRGDSVGSWLHGVALRAAGSARRRAARRRRHERRHAEMSSPTGIDPTAGRSPDDLDGILHEEIGRLPEKYRRPVVLCYLGGLTHDQAADQLGWPVGTVRRRLAGARDRLRGRLTRRGAAPSLAAGWEFIRPTVSVPSRLAEATVRGALRMGMGQRAALAGTVSAEAIALMKGVSQAMTTNRLIATTAAVLAMGLVTTGAGLLAYPGQPPGAQAALAQEKGQPPEGREKPGPADADGRSPDDQFDALLRQQDELIESVRNAAKAQMAAEEKKARAEANVGKLQGIDARILELAIRHPRTNAAERALIWIITSHVLSDETNKAWEILARDHAKSDRIKPVLSRTIQFHWASQAVEDLLRNALTQNPYREIRGLACYRLAELFRVRAENLRMWPLLPPGQVASYRQRFGAQDLERVLKQDPRALEHRARRLYDRILTEFSFVENNDAYPTQVPVILGRSAIRLSEVARVHLDELDRLAVGKVAPEIEGVDLDGQPMKLSDFRGKVVVLTFARAGFPIPDAPDRVAAQRLVHFGRLAPTIVGKPVALMGVVASDREAHQKAVQASGLPVRFWWDPDRPGQPEQAGGMVWGPRPGPIRTTWDAEMPALYVIDAKGVIRYTNTFGFAVLEKAVAAVLKEPEGAPDPK